LTGLTFEYDLHQVLAACGKLFWSSSSHWFYQSYFCEAE